MKFYQLLDYQSDEIKEKIEDHFDFGYSFSSNFTYTDVVMSFEKILSVDKDAIKYIDLIKKETLFEQNFLEKNFKTSTLEMLLYSGFFMFFPKASAYLVPEEFYFALLNSDEQILSYHNCTAKDLNYFLKSSKTLPKYKAISELLKSKSEKLSLLILEEFYKFYEKIYPIKKILTSGIPIYDLYEFLATLGPELNFFNSWQLESKALAELENLAPKLFGEGYILLSKNNYDVILIMSPAIHNQVNKFIESKLESLEKETLKNLTTYSDIKINSNFTELNHLTPELFYRVYSFIQACILNGKLTFNKKDGELKLTDIKKVAKLLSPWTSNDKLQAGNPVFEVTCVLIKELSKLSYVNLITLNNFKEELKAFFSFKGYGEHLNILLEASEEFPKNVWIDCSELYSLYKLRVKKSNTDKYQTLVSIDVFIKALIYLQSYFSTIDIAYNKKVDKSTKGIFTSMPKAIRFIKAKDYLLSNKFLEEIEKNSFESKDKIILSNNLEIILPLNLNLNKVTKIAKLFEIKDLYTLTTNEKHITSLVKYFTSKEDFIRALKENIDNDIPDIITRILDKIYNSREKIYLDTEFMYIYNPKVTELVVKLTAKKEHLINIDNRVLAFRYRPNLENLRKKLENNNFIVEGFGGVSSVDPLRKFNVIN